MKLSRFTFALALAASIGLSVTAWQVQCLAATDNPGRSAGQSGSPSYQAAQIYDNYECYYAGCHADFGDQLPDLPSDDTNVREQGLPPEPTNIDADLPGDEATGRDIPTTTTLAPPSTDAGFAHGNSAPQTVPARGYYAPGYPHPGYQHPNYGYSHTEVDGAWFPGQISAADAEDLTAESVAEEAALEEALVEEAVSYGSDPHAVSAPASGDAAWRESLAEEGFDIESYNAEGFNAEAWMQDALAENSFDAQQWMDDAVFELGFNAELWMLEALAELDFDAELWMLEALLEGDFNAELWMLEALAELDFDAELWMLEAIAQLDFDAQLWMAEAEAEELPATASEAEPAAVDLSQEYTRYDDTYGFQSEWYGPYDATKVLPPPTADAEVSVVSEVGLPADHSIVGKHEDSAASEIAEVDPAPAIDADQPAMVDYGPAELEVDAAAAANDSDAKDAAFEAAIRASRDDWFHRETYGFGPRYDYDSYGYEDLPANAPTVSTLVPNRSLAISAALSTASGSLPWDYVYRLELGDLLVDAKAKATSIQTPFARSQSSSIATYASEDELFFLAEETLKHRDPTIPASTDFDPAAAVSAVSELLGKVNTRQLLSDAGRLSRALTPMELARMSLAAVPVKPREYFSILIPQPKVIHIVACEPAMEADEALRELAVVLDDAGRALQMLSRRVEAFADATSPVNAVGSTTPLQSRNGSDLEKR